MQKLTNAKPPVTQMLAVGEPMNGNMPSKLQNRMNRNIVQRNGTKRSASSSPMVGLAMSLRTKVRSTSKAFHQAPLGSPPLAELRASGTKITMMSTAAISSSS